MVVLSRNRLVSLTLSSDRNLAHKLTMPSRLLAARYGGPCEGVFQTHPKHMTVNRPLNINDADIGPNHMTTEAPWNEPTDMSYFLQRLRLAEISRNIIDHISISNDGSRHYTQVLSMDFELDCMIKAMPPHFQMANYENLSVGATNSNVFVQAYMINSLLHTQRCKLHIAYLKSDCRADPAYLASRAICLKSAKEITRAELQLIRSPHSFVPVRLRLAAILYSIFIASIVLLMDVCIHRPASLQHELLDGDLSQALKILRGAKDHSLAAARLYDSLMHIVARHCAQHSQLPVESKPSPFNPSMSSVRCVGHPAISSSIFESSCSFPQKKNLTSDGKQGDTGLPIVSDGALPGNVPTYTALGGHVSDEDSESVMGVDEWGDLFSDMLSSSLF